MKPTARGRFRGSEAANGLAMISPTAIYALLLLAAPLAMIFAYSFMTDGYLQIIPRFQLCNYFGPCHSYKLVDGVMTEAQTYNGVWSDPLAKALMLRSLIISLVVTATTVLLAFPVAYFVSFHVSPSKKSLWLFLITIPFWTNLLIRTYAINEVIRNEGLLNTLLLKLGAINEPIQILYTDTAVFIGMAYVYLPLMVLPLFAAIDRFDMRLLEAGYDLYASRWNVLRRIILPITKPGIIAGSILVFVPSLGAYVTPRVLGGGKQMMIGNFIELQFGQGRNWPLGSALSLMLLIIVTGALLIYVRYANGDSRHG